MKILNFGSCNIDYVYSMDHIVTVGETATSHQMEVFPGGKGLNQSIAAAKAGAEVFHAGCVGSDGGILTDILKKSGVNTSYLKQVDAKNGHAIIQVSKDGENSIFLHPGSNVMITKEYADSVLKDFAEGDILMLQNEINDVDYLVDKAHSKGMKILLNPSPYNEAVEKIDFQKLSYIILNEVEARDISGQGDPEEALEFFRARYPELCVILTLGKKGAVLAHKDKRVRQSAYLVNAVDTTAAGDTFTGYFAAGLAESESHREILKLASAAAAISVSRKGAAPSIPHKSEVLSALNELTPNKPQGDGELFLERLESYIESNLKTANIKDFASLVGYSTAHTGNLIKRVSGQTFSGLLQEKRCKTAASLLSATSLSVSEIISRVGYENESFFRAKFKEKYNENPLEYRKKRG